MNTTVSLLRHPIGPELTRKIIDWAKGRMGWWLQFNDKDLKVGQRYPLFHPDYGADGYLEPVSDGGTEYGAVLVQPGGLVGDLLLKIEQEWHYWSDGSADDFNDEPPGALLEDFAMEFIYDWFESHPYSDDEFSAAMAGELSFWRDKKPLIPKSQWLDLRHVAGPDWLRHSQEGRRFLRRLLLPKRKGGGR